MVRSAPRSLSQRRPAGARAALVLPASTGGIGRHVASLSAGLVERGWRVTVCCPADTAARFDFAGEVVPVEIPGALGLHDRAVVATLRAALRYADVVHAHGLRAGLITSFARPPEAPLVVTWHNPVPPARSPMGILARVAGRRVARAADLTLGASSDLVAQATALGARNARLGPVAAPPRGRPIRDRDTVRAELGVPDGAPLLLSVGRLERQKGYHLLIDAAARWRSQPLPPVVAIAGTGPDFLDLTDHNSAARARVKLLGQRADVADLLGAADLAVVTSRWEARQLFAQEALAAGVPLVATAVGGIPELVGDAALLVPARDLDAFDAAVTRMLEDADMRARYSAAGPVRAADWPTEAQTVDLVVAAYAELTGVPVP
jgi:glycosyltransferase involved in cell wall biosynthesis